MAAVAASSSQSAGENGPQRNDKQHKDEELEELMRHEFTKLGISANPTEAQQGSRRRLLLIYVHGFMGSEESFRAFPAHVHNLLAILLQETHVVHSKIYPRYKSKQYIQVARDDFSTWLRPHESPETDVILLGHSMGGLIAAEIVLMPATDPRQSPFFHRILGTLNFDVPFLGMHPGVVRSGLASIFSPAKDPEDKYELKRAADEQAAAAAQQDVASSQGSDHVLDSNEKTFWETQDANFNARFSNDVVRPARKFWGSMSYFLNKHGRDVTNAAQNAASSYMKFMSAMSNGKELRARYARLRMLEEDDAKLRRSIASSPGRATPRVRFANYYTVSTGRSKASKQKSRAEDDAEHAEEQEENAEGKESVKDDSITTAIASSENRKDTDGWDIKAGDVDASESTNSTAPSTSNTTELTPTDEGKKINLPPFGEAISASRPTSLASSSKRSGSSQPNPSADQEPVKAGTFCTLPPKDSQGERDPTWVRMFMEDVDEVGAHCGMFFVDERYERFVGDVAARIEEWVRDDLSLRAIEAAMTVD